MGNIDEITCFHVFLNRAEEVAQHLEIQKTLQNDISKKKREIDKLRTDMARKELELQQASANKVQVNPHAAILYISTFVHGYFLCSD